MFEYAKTTLGCWKIDESKDITVRGNNNCEYKAFHYRTKLFNNLMSPYNTKTFLYDILRSKPYVEVQEHYLQVLVTPDVDLVRGTFIPGVKRPLYIPKEELLANHYVLKRNPYKEMKPIDFKYEVLDSSDFNVDILRFLPYKRNEFCADLNK